MMTMMVRTATPEDYAAVAPLAREIQAQHVAARPDIFRMYEPVLAEGYYHALLAEDDCAFLVAEYDGAIAGYAICTLRRPEPYQMFIPRSVVTLDTLVVAHALHGKGIGRALMDASVAWAKTRRAVALELTVYEFNTDAIAFYERLGMETLNRKMSLPLSDDETP